MRDEYIDEMISTTTLVSTKKLKTPENVEKVFRSQERTTSVVTNSAHGCASRIARLLTDMFDKYCRSDPAVIQTRTV